MAKQSPDTSRYVQSRALFERAAQVIPGGIYGHTSPAAMLPLRGPYYAQEGEGARYHDVDGNDYIDFMCGYGPIILGYAEPAIEEAAAQQRARGDCFNHPTALSVELAETLTQRIRFADWCVFAKNGSDLTTWAIQVAREHTGRKKILKVKGAYHGTDPWCSPGHGGVIEEDRAHVHSFRWNDLDSVEGLVKQFKGEVAALILTPFHHPAFGDSEMPVEGFLPGVQALCQREGILLALDDIRAGFRLHSAGSHECFGFDPDIAVYCKALANGYTLSAAVGRAEHKAAASKVFLTGSYWNCAVPMAASLACLRICEERNVPTRLEHAGKRLIDGLGKLGEQHGIPLTFSGPPAMPYMRISDEENFLQLQDLCAFALEEGVFLHPHHNWFLCAAHTEAEIDEALRRAARAFARFAELRD